MYKSAVAAICRSVLTIASSFPTSASLKSSAVGAARASTSPVQLPLYHKGIRGVLVVSELCVDEQLGCSSLI